MKCWIKCGGMKKFEELEISVFDNNRKDYSYSKQREFYRIIVGADIRIEYFNMVEFKFQEDRDKVAEDWIKFKDIRSIIE